MQIGDVTTRVGLDGTWVGANHGRSYVSFAVEPGQHRVCTDWQSSFKAVQKLSGAADLTAEAGKTYYYRMEVTIPWKEHAAQVQFLQWQLQSLHRRCGLIESFSAGLPNPLTVIIFSYHQGYLWVSATNIVNKGVLAADAASEIKLAGTNVNLSRSCRGNCADFRNRQRQWRTVFFRPIQPSTTSIGRRPTEMICDSEAIWDGTTAILPPFVPFPVAEPCGAAAMRCSPSAPPWPIPPIMRPVICC